MEMELPKKNITFEHKKDMICLRLTSLQRKEMKAKHSGRGWYTHTHTQTDNRARETQFFSDIKEEDVMSKEEERHKVVRLTWCP
jgi:hypothetical protein